MWSRFKDNRYFHLLLSYGQRWSENLSCPIDQKEDCERFRKWLNPIMFVSLFINLIGATYACIL